MRMQKGLTVVSSFHVKGGCGKTSTVSSLGVYIAHATPLNVIAVDMDVQGALYATLLGLNSANRYSPEQRNRYYEKFMQGFQPAKTKYTAVNQRLKVAHYPLEMFVGDRFSQEAHITGFEQMVEEAAKDSSLLLVDLPPGRLSTHDVKPFSIIDDIVEKYVFLIPSRPITKEVNDGVVNYGFAKKMLIAEGVSTDKIRGMLALNFSAVLRNSQESNLLRMISNACVTDGKLGFDHENIAYSVQSSFPGLDEELRGKGIVSVEIPQAVRTKLDMLQYCILLDRYFDLAFLEGQVKLQKARKEMDGEDAMYYEEYLEEESREVARAYDNQIGMFNSHMEYLKSIVLLAARVLECHPEVVAKMLERTNPPVEEFSDVSNY